jgi:hypothetical protein
MAWQRWRVAPGRRRSSPHTCSPIWSGGAHTITDVASSCLAARGARTATRARWQTGGTTVPTTYASDGSRQNPPTLVNARSPVLSFAAGVMLDQVSVKEVRSPGDVALGGLGEVKGGTSAEAHRIRYPPCCLQMSRKPARTAFTRAGRFIHHILWQHPPYTRDGSQAEG